MKALQGIRVLDLSQFLSGPRATQILADLGAEVIKIEQPGVGEGLRILTMLAPGSDRILSILNRNKLAMTLNLRSPRGREILKELAGRSDVLVENFTPGTMAKYGLDYPSLKKINPRIIYGAITGFGQTGPRSACPAFDIIAQATGGIMAANRQPDRVPGTFMADLTSGAYLALGVILSLFHRERTGQGQLVDVSMQDVMYSQNFPAMSRRALLEVRNDILNQAGINPESLMTEIERPVPFWRPYKAKNGYVAIVALTDAQWRRMMNAIGRPDLAEDERLSNTLARFINSTLSIGVMEAWTSQRTVQEIVEILDRAQIPCGPVQDSEALLTDPQLQSRGMLAQVPHPSYQRVQVPGFPIQFSETPAVLETAAPELGRDTTKILREFLSKTPEEIEGLREEGVI